MREYQPLLLSRPEYIRERSTSEFRETIWRVIRRLNPTRDKILFEEGDNQLNIRREHYGLTLAEFRMEAAPEVVKAARAMSLTEEAIALLDGVREDRAVESSQRWRASYDLVYAQLHLFRLRLFQFLLAVDDHVNNMPQPTNDESNEWNLWWDRRKRVPDESQFARLQTAFNLKMTRDEYLSMVREQEEATIALMEQVISDHPGTPWAARAQTEINNGFGFRVADRLWDPRGIRSTIQTPNL